LLIAVQSPADELSLAACVLGSVATSVLCAGAAGVLHRSARWKELLVVLLALWINFLIPALA